MAIVRNFAVDDYNDLFSGALATTVATEDFRYLQKADWRSDQAYEVAVSPEYRRPDDELLIEMRDDCDLWRTFKRGQNVIQMTACAKFHLVSLIVAGHDERSVRACISDHNALFEADAEVEVEADNIGVQFGFWYLGGTGPEREQKLLDVPAWEEIKNNYSAETLRALDGLMSGFKPAAGGRLMLWHGRPGTGKTFAIRALAWAWREWCQFEYVLDPERLFGAGADYLARMLIDDNAAGNDAGRSRWRTLVLEDTGELLSIDAKERAGQGLSRLLSAVDGLLGQSSRVMLLITTNEELGTLHPAVTRPGRCASQIEFLPLSHAEAKLWFEARRYSDGGIAPAGSRTIAELYALAEGRAIPEAGRIGFTGAQDLGT